MPVESLSRSTIAANHSRTYSLETNVVTPASPERCERPQLELFLEEENPLGCIRGVMWVMVFNAGAVLGGIAIWKILRLIF